ncbi:porin family protein [Spirosoma validum]|uniref:PorT family protein n=1 Tax=Spirosoma validum TaxID=2771355 RepID=A0A927GF52_9BACT|nr:porin family protein [Spirosoma validum]MBD2755363.1 PorT family protein [Spirosoma validum]
MKTQLTLLFLLVVNVTIYAQTRPKTRSVAAKPVPQKLAEPAAERIAARTRAKLDSIQKVQALAREMARQLFVEDSLQRARQLATQQAEARSKPAHSVSTNQAMVSRPTARPATRSPLQGSASHEVARRGILFGVRGSLLLNKPTISADVDDPGEPSYYLAPGAALLVSIPFGDSPLSLQLEPGYAERGGLFTAKGLMNNGVDRYEDKTTYKLQSLELPVLLRIEPIVGPINIIVTAGVDVRYLLGGTSAYKGAEYNIRTGTLVRSKADSESIQVDKLNRLDVGLVGGLGVVLPTSFGYVFIDGRYHHGLMNLAKEQKSAFYQRGLSANVGILVSLHR